MSVPTVAAAVVAAPPTLLLATFVAEVLAGLRPIAAPAEGGGAMPSTTVLIPAHDEAAGIGATIAAVLAAAGDGVDILVVADNCSDDTAARASAAGARVAERHDPVRRGKGYALAFGREVLAAAPPGCVVIVDADCVVEAGGIAVLARAAMTQGRAVQACYLQRPDPAAPPTARISSFAFLVKNLVRQRGMTRLGGVAALTGTGMALPWTMFARVPLASADLVEDLALGVWLTRAGEPPRFLEQVAVWSDAASGRDLITQRGRWERGFLRAARRQALPLIGAGLARASRSRLWLGMHLLVPPLALLFAGAVAVLAGLLLLALAGASLVPAAALAAALAAASAATLLAWRREGRAQVSGRALLGAPLYVLGKLPLYRSMLRRDGNGWVRTRRPGEDRA